MILQKDIIDYNDNKRILLRTDDYIYLLPHQALCRWISNYTITFPNKDIMSDSYTVIPHGSATLVFSFDYKGIHSDLFGPMTRSYMVGDQGNQSDLLLIIEFQPAGLHAFTGITQKELVDSKFPFELINKLLNKSMEKILYSTRSIYELITAIDSLFLSNMLIAGPSELQLAIQLIIRNMGNISHVELYGSVYYSERHLNRIFNQYLGMNVKTFSRMVRINKAIQFLQNPQNSIMK